MTREWKPGDVAMVVKHGQNEHLAVFTDDGWVCQHNILCGPHEIRPLVVIDPEDREQVERLADLIDNAESVDLDNFAVNSDEWALNAMRAALREFANPTPPKPEEPTGLGAVVEDADGRKYVRVAQPFDGWMKDRDWQQIGGDMNAVRNFGWSGLDVVRVLSEGVAL